MAIYGLTWQIPWFTLVEIHVPDSTRREARVQELLQEVACDDLLIRGVEPEPGRQEQVALLLFHTALHHV
jgi:hypothetical protein